MPLPRSQFCARGQRGLSIPAEQSIADSVHSIDHEGNAILAGERRLARRARALGAPWSGFAFGISEAVPLDPRAVRALQSTAE